MIVLFLVFAVLFLAAFAALHWYAWRLVRDLTARRSVWWRTGTVVFIVGPVLGLAAVRDDMPGIPFAWEGAVDWPGYMWLALFLYLVLALAVGELIRPLLHRALARRAATGKLPSPPDPSR
ncbi:MAG TPA: hypothetical protein VN408_31660 [Actinoplanes sp.]|nr:hypothetical protein [Actinoplanes sp.]